MTSGIQASPFTAAAGDRGRRAALFHETPAEWLERIALGTAWALKPQRIGDLGPLARLWLHDLVLPAPPLPDPDRPLTESGLCGIVHDPSPALLLEGYRRGLFTFAHFGPLKWLSPAERCILDFKDFHIEKSLRRIMRQGRYTVTFDRDFEGVIKACAGRRPGRWHVTWITPRIMRLYGELFDAGHVHSIELWNAEGELVGGSYGVAVGGVFFGESQFSAERNASKMVMAALTWHLAQWGFAFSDGKWETPTMKAMGFQTVPRAEFCRRVAQSSAREVKAGRWQMEADLAAISTWQPGGGSAAA